MRAVYMVCVGAFLAACGGSTTPVTDPGLTDDAGTPTDDAAPEAAPPAPYPAINPDMPRVVSLGGPVLKTPSVTPVYFPGFAYPDAITDLSKKIGVSKYWAALSEYGVGPITAVPPVALTAQQIVPADIGPITDDQIQAWLIARFDGTHPEFGNSPDPNTIYALYYPSSTVISLAGSKSCQSFGGYHNNVTIQNQLVAYAVMPDCGAFAGLKGVDAETTTTSHELSEAVTDPFPSSDPNYSQVDNDHLAWQFYLGGGEVGDLCAQFSASIYKPDDLGYYVQKNWSNAQAKAGHDPCQPANDGDVYFNSAPTFADKIPSRGTFTKGVKVPVGESRTIPLALYSDAPTTGPWTVTAQALARNGSSTLTLALDKKSGQNGDIINLTITSKAAITSNSKTETILIVSQLGTRKTIWVGVVGN